MLSYAAPMVSLSITYAEHFCSDCLLAKLHRLSAGNVVAVARLDQLACSTRDLLEGSPPKASMASALLGGW